jgi:hypothetical protein
MNCKGVQGPLHTENAARAHILGRFQEAKSKHAEMLFLPECCSFIGKNQQEVITVLLSSLSESTHKRYASLSGLFWL